MLFLALIAGHFLCAAALSQLGQSFSAMPEARRRVTSWIYSRVRHPLYLAEAVATIGILLQYRSVGAAALVAAQSALQVWRMHEEETVLEAQFSEHGEYRRRSARLVPGVH